MDDSSEFHEDINYVIIKLDEEEEEEQEELYRKTGFRPTRARQSNYNHGCI